MESKLDPNSKGILDIFYYDVTQTQPKKKQKEDHQEEHLINQDLKLVKENELKQTEMLRKFVIEGNNTTPSFREVLYKGTREHHMRVLEVTLLKELTEGKMTCSREYVHYLINLYCIYAVVEKGLKEIDSKYERKESVFPEVSRTKQLQEDAQLWSMFNETAALFEEVKVGSEEFHHMLMSLAEESTKEYVKHLEELIQKDPLNAIGSAYALIGSVMFGGGPLAKKGVRNGFDLRIDLEEDEESKLKMQTKKSIEEDGNQKEIFAQKSISFFTFADIQNLKERWLNELNTIPEKVDEKERENFQKLAISEAGKTIDLIVAFTESAKQTLKKDKYVLQRLNGETVVVNVF